MREYGECSIDELSLKGRFQGVLFLILFGGFGFLFGHMQENQNMADAFKKGEDVLVRNKYDELRFVPAKICGPPVTSDAGDYYPVQRVDDNIPEFCHILDVKRKSE